MKLIGLAIIFIAAAYGGFYIGDKYRFVLNGIKRAENLLGTIVFGIQNERVPLSELFNNIASNGDKQTNEFMRNIELRHLDKAQIIAEQCGFCNDKTAIAILSEAFSILGKYSAAEQIKELEYCRNKLRAHYEKIREPFLIKIKLSRYSGIFTGILLSIILI